ncbi:hypothetical protein Anas_02490 [Armadillidium nasatum]|uniref:Uncharacterized protein n=1 Tax=Armadillidium nasatum TaxID=96803 RepID=A0A5N5TFN1_9CRUS|nr:hypothetical protein Anas_02490 [Armadillidium nasatum]
MSYNIENLFGTTTFVTSSETGPEIDGRDFSETTSPVINLTTDPFTLNTPSDNQSKLSSPLNYSLSNESLGTTFSSYLKTDDIVTTETPIGRFTSDITSKEIPLTTNAILVSTTAEKIDSTILVSNASTSEEIISTIFENEHESRDKRSAPENYNVSNEADEILEAIKTELEEGDLTEESFLKLEKYIKQINDLIDIQSTKLNSSLIELIIKDAKNLRKTIKIIVSARDIGKRSVPPFDFLKRPIILWGSVIVAVVFIAVILLLCLIVHCKVSNLSRKLDEIRSENTMKEESKNSATIFTLIPRGKNDTPTSDFGSKHIFSTERIRNFEGPLSSTKLNSSRI